MVYFLKALVQLKTFLLNWKHGSNPKIFQAVHFLLHSCEIKVLGIKKQFTIFYLLVPGPEWQAKVHFENVYKDSWNLYKKKVLTTIVLYGAPKAVILLYS